jgi:hypothetical protein
MTILTFVGARRGTGDPPIEVRRSNMSLVGRAVASGQIAVAPGTYFVTMRLPDGGEMTRHVDVTGAEREIAVDLAEDAGALNAPVAPPPMDAGGSAGAGPRFLPELDILGPPPRHRSRAAPAPEIELWQGNALDGRVARLERPPLTPIEGVATISGTDHPQFACLTVGPSVRWFALPAWGESACDIAERVVDGTADLDIVLEHAQANLLLQLRSKGQVADAETATRSASLTSERLLRDKRRDPIAAVVSAYTLLRFNDLERLHDWTSNLFNAFPALPDGAVILGEHLGRNGEHAHALPALLKLRERGLPIFSEGIVLAMDRLTLYARYGGDVFDAAQREAAEALAAKLGRFAELADFSRQTTVLKGTLPV